MNVLDYVYTYVTEDGYRGLIRVDSEEEPIERKHDFYPNKDVIRKKKYYYICEDGNDGAIASFKSFFKAKTFAEEHDEVKEIFEYMSYKHMGYVGQDECGNEVYDKVRDHEVVGLVWKR